MADTSGMAEIRGINIDKLAKAYEDEALVFKKLVNNRPTSAREIRWYSKTSGFLTATSPAKIANVAQGARPFVLEQSWTRTTSYVRKYMVESPTITMEDESDNDVNLVLTNLQDLTSAVAYQVDSRIWNVITENQSPVNINSVTATAAWDAASGQNPIEDILEAKQDIRENTKRPLNNGVLLVSAKGEKDLLTWLITSKGNYITEFTSKKVQDGVLMTLVGLKIIVSENVTADYAAVGDLKMAASWLTFKPITSTIINDEGIGKKIRVWELGECILERPKYMALISNTEA